MSNSKKNNSKDEVHDGIAMCDLIFAQSDDHSLVNIREYSMKDILILSWTNKNTMKLAFRENISPFGFCSVYQCMVRTVSYEEIGNFSNFN